MVRARSLALVAPLVVTACAGKQAPYVAPPPPPPPVVTVPATPPPVVTTPPATAPAVDEVPPSPFSVSTYLLGTWGTDWIETAFVHMPDADIDIVLFYADDLEVMNGYEEWTFSADGSVYTKVWDGYDMMFLEEFDGTWSVEDLAGGLWHLTTTRSGETRASCDLEPVPTDGEFPDAFDLYCDQPLPVVFSSMDD